MVDLQTLLTYLTLIAVPVGVFYHILTLYNTRKNQQLQLETRQAQLYMSLINTFNSLEFRKQWHILESAKWIDYDDFNEKYPMGSETLTAATMHFIFFDSIGGLVEKKLIDIELIDGTFALNIVLTWRMCESIIYGNRKSFNSPTMWKPFEFLYNELNKREEFTDSTPFHRTQNQS